MKVKTFAAFSCVHVPHYHEAMTEWMLKLLKANSVDVVVNLGDFLNADAASKFVSESEPDLLSEYEMADELLERIEAATEGASRVWMEGNHEYNIGAQGRIDQRVRRLCDWTQGVKRAKHWKVIPYRNSSKGVYKLGQVAFAHGYECGVSSDRFQAQRFAPEWGLFVSGHTHRPVPVQRVQFVGNRMLNRAVCNVGCFADAEALRYTERLNTQAWGAAVCIGAAVPHKSPRAKPYWLAELIRPGMPVLDYAQAMREELQEGEKDPLGCIRCHPVLTPEPGMVC